MSWNRGHERIDRRQLVARCLQEGELDWPEARQAFVVINRRTTPGDTAPVILSYGVTSLGREEADVERLLRLCRGHERSRVFEVDASHRTRQLNAHVTGIGGSARPVLWDTLQKLARTRWHP